ncbi:hypothetical protein GZH82_06810 [Staphylococcus ursi]|uniref:class III lanthionine synthetase LanKC N-terminal domain-containing protein n=1 Tax=Staphylococcus sp. MI 10-1553 TaxID=1912064 RepID=UPI001397DAD1|nr:hypothetical protein [Staphylococcus sp. MI 10-1553]QHW37054.1 hypothetical protein GZH82_06810 [Staphylococcus sp. MI 10-1553]
MENYNSILHKIVGESKGRIDITLKRYWLVFGNRADIPKAGKKIHVSIGKKIDSDFIINISSMLNRHGHVWKIPNDIYIAKYLMSDSDNYRIKGKFFTIYPRDNKEFFEVIGRLLLVDEIFDDCIDVKGEYRILNSRIFFRYYDKEVESI